MMPALPIGVSGRFRAVAYIRGVASPNEDTFLIVYGFVFVNPRRKFFLKKMGSLC